MRVMPEFVHAVYGRNDLYAQVLLPYSSILADRDCGTSSFYVLRAHLVRRKSPLHHENDHQSGHRHGILGDVPH